ncbi:MAG: AAA family ATPase [Cyanobacteria bacterium J06632_3]
MSEIIFEWMWSQIADDITPHKRSTYRAILNGAWQGQTYTEIAKDLQYSEVYLRQDLAPQLWKILSTQFKTPLTKKTFKSTLSQQYQTTLSSSSSPLSPLTPHPLSPIPHSSNPFGDRGCLTSDDRFFDRTTVLEEIFAALSSAWNISVVGERQVGKSSLLAKVCRHAPQRLGLDSNQIIYLDMELIHTEETFFHRLCKEIGIENCRGYDLLEATEGRKYILCIDEIEKMRNPQKFSGDERDELRGLSDGDHMPFTLVTASRTPLDELFPDDTYSTSPFFNIFQQIRLMAFSADVSEQFLRHRLQGLPIQFSHDQIHDLIQNSGGHPATLQQLAKALYLELSQA